MVLLALSGESMLSGTLLHIGFYDGPFLLAWRPEPIIALFLMAAAGFYWFALRRIRRLKIRTVPRNYPIFYYAGLAVLVTVMGGPVHVYNEMSFSLHMAQHVGMMLIAAPLLLLGRPVHIFLWALPPQKTKAVLQTIHGRTWVRTLLDVFANPIVILLLLNVNLVVWHLPNFYVAALENPLIHELEHAMFMGTAMLFWWVIIDPIPRHHRVRTDIGIAMLFISGAVGDLLSLYLIFVQDVMYPFYLTREALWGMSQMADQRLGGLVMLLVGIVVFYGSIILLISKSFRRPTPVGSTLETGTSHFEPGRPAQASR